MLHVNVDLVPLGFEEAKRLLSTLMIANDGTGDQEYGNYEFLFVDNKKGQGPTTVCKGRVKGHRVRDEVWKLIYLILKEKYEK